MRLKIVHETRYEFDSPVTYGLQQLRKTPKSYRAQTVTDWHVILTGGKSELHFEDFNRNTVELISFEKGTTALTVRCEGEVEMADTHGVIGRHDGPAPLWLYNRPTARTRPGAGCREIVGRVPPGEDLERLHALSTIIRDDIVYEVGVSHVGWTAEEVIEDGRGVCQDHAHVFIACARHMGFPARYVSGYLMMNDRVDQDATHAWAEAYVDSLGWVGFDISNGISPDTRYVRVATGLDYGQAAPVTGLRQGGHGEALSVTVEVAQQ